MNKRTSYVRRDREGDNVAVPCSFNPKLPINFTTYFA